MEEHGSALNSDRLLALLRDQLGFYQRLHELCQRQKNLIAGDRPELLLDILRDRQALVMSLSRTNEQLSPYRSDWENVYAGLPPAARDQASRSLDDINHTLQAILQSDQEDGALLAARKQVVARSLADIGGGRMANTAYARQGRAGAGGGADVTG